MGTYQLTNTLGGLLAVGFVLLIAMFFNHPISATKNKTQRIFLFFIILAVVFCLAMTKCRSAFVAVGVGIILLSFVSVNALRSHLINVVAFVLDKLFSLKHVSLIVLVLLLFGGTCFFGGSGGKSVLAGAKRSLGFRLEYWRASCDMIGDYPLFGCGSGNFKQTYTRYKLPQSSEEIADPHNFLVEVAATAGLPAVIFLAVPLGILVFHAFFLNCKTKNPPPELRSMTAGPTNRHLIHWSGLAGCLLAFLISFNGEAPMDFTAPIFAVLAFGAVYFLFLRTENAAGGVLSPALWAVALSVLGIHLLAAGGISATNSALIFWLFAALLANRDPWFEKTVTPKKPAVLAVFSCVAVVIVGIYFVNMKPVLGARTHSAKAEEAQRNNFAQIVWAERIRATEKDPLSADCREALATEYFRHWLATPQDEKILAEILRNQDVALKLLPRSASLRYGFARQMALAYEKEMREKSGDAALRDRAVKLFHDAIERYPNNAQYRAAFAVFLAVLPAESGEDDLAEARKQRDEALRLDDLMSHADQKLPGEIRRQLDALF